MPKASELVSVIMPAYNAQEYISQAIDSVIQQSNPNWELWVINDASTDKTAEIIEKYANKEPRIKFIHMETGSGTPAAPRNIGLQNAKGQFIAFLDADDVWLPDKLEKQIAFMRANDVSICYAYYQRIDHEGNQLSVVKAPLKLDYNKILESCFMGILTVLIDKNITGEFRFNEDFFFRGREDYILWMDLLKKNPYAHCLSETVAQYRVVPGSISRSKLRVAKAQWYVYRQTQNLSFLKSLQMWLKYAYYGFVRNLR